MCGIAGYVTARPPSKEFLGYMRDLVIEMESRGDDATGAAWLKGDTGALWCFKAAVPAKAAMAGEWWTEHFPEHKPRLAIFHTRAATGGASPKKAINNHPFVGAYGALIHNGILFNHTGVDRRLGFYKYRKSATDTETLLLVAESEMGRRHKSVEAHGPNMSASRRAAILSSGAEFALDEVGGSVACAYLSHKLRALMLFKGGGSPLNIVLLPNGDWVFASTKASIYKAFAPLIPSTGPLKRVAACEAEQNDVFVVTADKLGVEPKLVYRQARSTFTKKGAKHANKTTIILPAGGSIVVHENMNAVNKKVESWKACADCNVPTSGAFFTRFDGAGVEQERRCYTCGQKYIKGDTAVKTTQQLKTYAKCCMLCKSPMSIDFELQPNTTRPSNRHGALCMDCDMED